MFDINIIKQAISMLEEEASFTPDKWGEGNAEKDVISIKELSKPFQKDFVKAFYIKKLNDVASAKYKEFSEPALSYYEDNSYKKILSGADKDLVHTNGSTSVSLDEKAWKEKYPQAHAKVFAEFQKTTARKGSISWK